VSFQTISHIFNDSSREKPNWHFDNFCSYEGIRSRIYILYKFLLELLLINYFQFFMWRY